MPKCKYCEKEISKFDNDICPFCGGKHPIDENYQTMDITQNISNHNSSYELYKSKKMNVYVCLCAFLGIFGIHNFYLGFKNKGLFNLIFTILFTGIIGAICFFLIEKAAYMFIVPLCLLYLFYIVYAFLILRKKDSLKDSSGEFLR